MEEILQLISTYGTPLVITALVIYGLFRVVNILIGRLEGSPTSFTESQRRHDRLLEVRREVNDDILAILERTLIQTRADRAFVVEFHNGSSNLSGLPFLRMSNTYEALAAGVPSQRANFEQMPITLFADLLSQITRNPYIFVQTADREGGGITTLYREILVDREVRTSILVRITDLKGKVIGYCGINYLETNLARPGDVDIERAKELAVELGALLSVDKKF